MPQTERSLQSVFRYFLSLHADEHVHTQKIGKNQEVKMLGDRVLMGDEAKHIEALKTAEAKAFEKLVDEADLSLNDDVDTISRQGKCGSLMHLAIQRQRLDFVVALLDHGASPMIEDTDGNSCIMLAAEKHQSNILDEFVKLIENDSLPQPASSSSKSDNPTIKSGNIDAKASDKKDPETKAPSNTPKKTERVKLSVQDLKRENRAGHTVYAILEKSLLASGAANETKISLIREAHQDPVHLLREMVQHLKSHTEEKVTLPSKEVDEAYNRYLGAVAAYSIVFNQFNQSFIENKESIVLKNPGEKIAKPVLNAFVDSEKDRPVHVILTYDRAIVAGVLELLYEYSCFSWRLSWKHFRADAAKLISPYTQESGADKKSISEVKDVIEFYQAVSAELLRVNALDHHVNQNDHLKADAIHRVNVRKEALEKTAVIKKFLAGESPAELKNEEKEKIELYQSVLTTLKDVQSANYQVGVKNDQFNSEYCRRLYVSKGKLEETAIIRNFLAGGNRFDPKRYAEYLECTHHKLKLPQRK